MSQGSEQTLKDTGSAQYFRADHSTLGTSMGPQIPWWLSPADDEVAELRSALVELASRLEVEGFVGHEECPMPGESDFHLACKTCRALDVAHRAGGTVDA